MAQDNKSLGRFILDGIPPSPRGTPQIEVTFDIDANGILNVSAMDKATKKEQKITIKNATQLTDEEVDKMKADAEKHAEEDKKKKEEAETRNQAETLVFTAEKTLKDAGNKVKEEDKKDIEGKIKKVKDELAKQDIDKEALDGASKELSEALQKVGAAMYEQAQKKEKEKGKDKKGEKKTKKKKTKAKDKDKKGQEEAEEGKVVE